MYSFKNDYSEGAHPSILNALVKSNLEQTEGYGLDKYTEHGKNLIKTKMKKDDADIFFFSGGTQTNLTSLSAFLKPYEAIISADSGHILVHETGAIEATGHKVISVDNCVEGKLTTDLIKNVLDIHIDEHMVMPKLVYISNPTELGSIYSKDEMISLSNFCRANDLIFYVDGARLGSALTSKENDLTLEDFGILTDAFYIGGTKNGALLGEALVINNKKLSAYYRFNMKQKGALLAKGRLLSIQFIELFTDDLYFKLGRHANDQAEKLGNGIKKLGYKFLTNSSTNQIFPILPNDVIQKLEKKFSFYIWQPMDENSSAIRLITSWATKDEPIDLFLKELEIHS